eukprot:Lithocolla_globosa_v1_NODE_3646_length_1616_cov_19.184497.p2 type:complete len:122 gc:universal NODE_3646_length_1616_cov_19.184497:560-195(-)
METHFSTFTVCSDWCIFGYKKFRWSVSHFRSKFFSYWYYFSLFRDCFIDRNTPLQIHFPRKFIFWGSVVSERGCPSSYRWCSIRFGTNRRVGRRSRTESFCHFINYHFSNLHFCSLCFTFY